MSVINHKVYNSLINKDIKKIYVKKIFIILLISLHWLILIVININKVMDQLYMNILWLLINGFQIVINIKYLIMTIMVLIKHYNTIWCRIFL